MAVIDPDVEVRAAVAGVRMLLDALTPEPVWLALDAAEEVVGHHHRAIRPPGWQVSGHATRPRRRERAFSQVEMENRLVAHPEAPVGGQAQRACRGRAGLESARAALPPMPGLAWPGQPAKDCRQPAGAVAPPTATSRDCRLLRTLIADVTWTREPDRAKAWIGTRRHAATPDGAGRRASDRSRQDLRQWYHGGARQPHRDRFRLRVLVGLGGLLAGGQAGQLTHADLDRISDQPLDLLSGNIADFWHEAHALLGYPRAWVNRIV